MLWQFGTPLVWENHPHSKPNLVVPIVFDLEVLSDQKDKYTSAMDCGCTRMGPLTTISEFISIIPIYNHG